VWMDGGEGGEETVCFIGVDTPETNHPDEPVKRYGEEEAVFTELLLPAGTDVQLETDVQERDKYGRLLAYVYLSNGRMINEALLSVNYA